MFRSDLEWHFPETVEEAAGLLRGREVVPHAGGTGLLRSRSPGLRGLVDLARLPLRYRTVEDGWCRLGALLTFAELAEAAGPSGPTEPAGHPAPGPSGEPADRALLLLAGALDAAASTPLRHRITLGGSVADSPPWSDLAPALLALGAEIELLASDGSVRRLPYEAYLAARLGPPGTRAPGLEPGGPGGTRGAAHLVREAAIPLGRVGVFHQARLARVRFDYAPCHLVMAARLEGGRLRGARVYVTGTRGRFRRLEEVEQGMEGRPPSEVEAGADGALEAEFASDPRFSAQYKARWVRVQVRDGLRRMGEESA